METPSHRGADWRSYRFHFRRLTVASCAVVALPLSILQADIPWPEVERRLAEENGRLAQRPQGHAGEFFVVCTLYYTPMESGFTADRGFDATLVTKPGLS